MLGSWITKFRVAFSGLFWAARDQNSFHFHAAATVLVIGLAAVLGLELWQWIALVIAIGGVWTAELLNSAIELIVAVIHPQHDERIGRALDVAAAAVLMAAFTAVTIGVLVFGPILYQRLITV